MANASGIHHQEPTTSFNGTHSVCNNGTSISEGSAAMLKHNPGISCEWSADEQAVLDEGLIKFVSETNINRYAKIAIQLPNKTVRDVALRCRWMTKQETSKKRKEESLSKKSKEKKEKGNEPRLLHYAPQSNVSSYPSTLFPLQYGDGISFSAIGGLTGELLEQNALTFSRISSNFSVMHTQENIDLLRQARDNIIQIMNNLNEAPETMRQMPPLPVRLNEELAMTILPPCGSSLSLPML